VAVIVVVAGAVSAGVAWFIVVADEESSAVDNGRSGDDAARLQSLVRQAGLEDPGEVELPVAVGATAEWFESDGALLVEFVEQAKMLWADPEVECDALGGVLDESGGPGAVAGMSASVPDEVSRELFIDLYASTLRAMEACQVGQELGEFAWQWALADRRLDELGVQR
jgi:hypothetical protein